MNAVRVDRIAATWESFQAASGLGHIANERHYDQVIELMNRIADDGAMDPAHRLHGMFMLAADLVRQYEQEAYPAPDIRKSVRRARFRDLVGQAGSQQESYSRSVEAILGESCGFFLALLCWCFPDAGFGLYAFDGDANTSTMGRSSATVNPLRSGPVDIRTLMSDIYLRTWL